MKKEIKAVIAVVLAVWFFLMGFEIGKYRERSSSEEATIVQTVITTVAATVPVTTTASAVVESQTQATVSGETQSTDATSPTAIVTTQSEQSDDPSALTKEQIIENMAKAINDVKQETNVRAVKNETVTINVTDCSIQSAVSIINNVINRFAGSETETYAFVNGTAVGTDADGKELNDGNPVTPAQVIPPDNREFLIAAEGVAEASAAKQGEDTVYTITLVEENTTFTSPVPTFHSAAFGYLDLTTLDISGATITDATMHYPGTIITVTVNSDGKIVKLHFDMEMSGTGVARIFGLSGTASFEGFDDETWDFTY